MKAVIVAIEGEELLPEEAALLESHPPAGVILFGRNVGGALPLARLVGDLREVLPREALLLVDQEGGRVARLGPPDWRAHPSAGAIGARFGTEPAAGARLAWLTGALIGMDCNDSGFDVVCAPVLDLWNPSGTPAIGDRSYGSRPADVISLGQSMADGLLSAGVQPVGKHAPGHGRARVDSHHALPRIGADEDLADDIAIFAACVGLPWLMTAHIIYEALDADRPATLSPIVIEGVIRGTIGFQGVLVSDDLAMGALADGPWGATPAQLVNAALDAGCDIAMHCSGRMVDLRMVLQAAPELSDEALGRLARGRSLAERCQLQLDRHGLAADQAAMLA